MIAANPIVCHAPDQTKRCRNMPESPITSVGPNPNNPISLFVTPVFGLVRTTSRPTTTTVEMKCGA